MWEILVFEDYKIMNYFNHFTFSALLTSITTFLLGIFVLLKGRWEKRLYQTFALYCFSISLWSLCVTKFTPNFHDPTGLWGRFLHLGAILIPAFLVHFVLEFLGEKNRKLLIVTYSVAAIFLIFNFFTELFIKGTVNKPAYSYPNPTGVYALYFIFFILCVIYGLYKLFKASLIMGGIRRNQIRYLLWSSVLGYLGGLKNFMILIGLEVFPIYPYGTYAIPFYTLVVVYAIVTYRLMDINVAITKGTVFAVVYAFVLGIPVGVGFWGGTYLSGRIGPNWWLVPVGIALLLATLGPAIYGFIRRKAEATFFKQRQKYQENLIALGKRMTLTKDLRSLLILIIRSVTREIGISYARIYLLDRKANEYAREVCYGKERRRQFGDSILKDSPLVLALYKNKEVGPLLKEEIISYFQTNEPEHLEKVEAQLRSMGAAILLPAFIGEELVAFLALGTKRSKEIYTPDDLAMFKILAGQAALAIENAQFYQELKESQATLLQAAKLSSIGELAAGFAHQIDNPLGIISLGSQLCVRDIKEWLSRGNVPENDKKVLEEINDRMNRVISTAHRAADLVQRIRGYAKPSDSDFEATDLNSVMESALVLAQYQISRGGININRDIPRDLPKIKGIGVQLEQVFLNMIMNACEAMAGKKGELGISARVAKECPDSVEVVVLDNGHGISKENLNRIFDLFFTTKGPQGTGVGLSIAHRIIKDHGGEISVESKVGEGTKFTVHLPIWQEKA